MVIPGKQFLCDQRLLKQQAEGAGEVLKELEEWGLVWDRDAAGNISLLPLGKIWGGLHDYQIHSEQYLRARQN